MASERPWRCRVWRRLSGPSPQERRAEQSDGAWATGARGEQILAESLTRRCPEVPLLHDRRYGHRRANIDHLAIAATGVYVIETKRYRGKIQVRNPLFGAARLRIAGRDQTRLVDGLRTQVAAVRAVVSELAPDVAVHGCFCFVAPDGLLADSGLPLWRTLRIEGLPLYHPRSLARKLNKRGPMAPDRARALHAELAARLPPAV